MKFLGCQGSSMEEVSITHLDPFMIMQYVCNDCKGIGETINYKDICPYARVKKWCDKKILEVIIEKGMQNGQKITFPREADEAPDMIIGDIIFFLQQKEHPKFKIKGCDFVENSLSLIEALCGF
eukprot:Gb_35156 [translate_table: standard]